MPRFAANLSLLYAHLPSLERIKAAKEDGFEAIECQFPYQENSGAALNEIVKLMTQLDLPMVLHNLRGGDLAKGDRGLACDPARVEEFRKGILDAILYAQHLGVMHVNCLAGILPEGISRKQAQKAFIENLTYAAEELKKSNIKLLIEPINTFDVPGFFLSTSQHALETLMAVQSSNLYLQYDAYHAHRMGEDILSIEELMPFIEHIQIADHPGRHEPGTGEINYPDFFILLDDLGYKGWVGCEYIELHQANFLKI
jgi:hydroxypyruvate isomerase